MRHRHVAVFTTLIIFCIKLGRANIIVHPTSYEAQIGELAFFNCSTDKTSEEIQWFHYPDQNSERKLVFGFNQFHDVYRGFRMGRVNSTGSWNLVFPSVGNENAGKYECQDDIGRGEKSSANLIVLDSTELKSHIATTKVIGNNNCGIDPSELILTCSVRYHGIVAPIFGWKKVGDDKPIIDGVTQEILQNNRAIYNLTLKGDKVTNRSSYACYATRSTSSKAYYKSDSIIVVGNVTDANMSTCKSDSCQSYIVTNILLILLIIIGIPLFNAITAGVIWYLLIRPSKQRDSEGRRNQRVFSRDAIIFVLLMAIPFCIGLLLWYQLVYRRTQRKTEKGQRQNAIDSVALIDQSQNTQEPQRLDRENDILNEKKKQAEELEDKIKNLEKEKEILNKKKKYAEELERKIKILEDEKLILNESVMRQSEEIGAMRECQNKLIEAKKQVSELETTLFKMIKAPDDQRTQILTEHQSETLKSLRNENIQQEGKIKEMQENIQTFQAENDSLKHKIANLEQHIYSPEKLKYANNPIRVRRIKTSAALKKGDWISGMAILKNELVVVHRKSSEMEIYDSITYKFQRKLPIPIIGEPFDLTVGKADNCLFIIGLAKQTEGERKRNEGQSNENKNLTEDIKDEVPGTIDQGIGGVIGQDHELNLPLQECTRDVEEKTSSSKNKENVKLGDVKTEGLESVIVRLDANGNLFNSWPKPSGGIYGQISVYGSNLIVCLLEKNIINEFSNDGDIVHTVRLSPAAGFKNLLHAVKLTSMHYAVSHGYEKDEIHRICVVDLEGNIKMECKEWENTIIKGPIHFILDEKRSLLVADEFNHRISLLDCDLKLGTTLIKLEDEDCPRRLCVDDAKNILFVAVNKTTQERRHNDGRILIYKIK